MIIRYVKRVNGDWEINEVEVKDSFKCPSCNDEFDKKIKCPHCNNIKVKEIKNG